MIYGEKISSAIPAAIYGYFVFSSSLSGVNRVPINIPALNHNILVLLSKPRPITIPNPYQRLLFDDSQI